MCANHGASSSAIPHATDASGPTYCAPCGRAFKTVAGWAGHLKGKKHKNALERMDPKCSLAPKVALGVSAPSMKPRSIVRLERKLERNKRKKEANLLKVRECTICAEEFPGKVVYVEHLESLEHAEKAAAMPPLIKCLGCRTDKMSLSSWDEHECAVRKEGAIECNLCGSSSRLKNHYKHCRKSYHQNRLQKLVEAGMDIRKCEICSDMLVLDHSWELHVKSTGHCEAVAEKDAARDAPRNLKGAPRKPLLSIDLAE